MKLYQTQEIHCRSGVALRLTARRVDAYERKNKAGRDQIRNEESRADRESKPNDTSYSGKCFGIKTVRAEQPKYL